jgi:hypothetical protein
VEKKGTKYLMKENRWWLCNKQKKRLGLGNAPEAKASYNHGKQDFKKMVMV